MSEPMTIRCSSTDRVMACASSLTPTATPYTPNHDEAREGTAVHEALAVVVAGAEPDMDAISDKHRVERDNLVGLINWGRQAWDKIQKYFPHPEPEKLMSAELGDGVVLRGTADVVSVVAPSSPAVAVLDWKSGWKPSEHPYQLMSYATLAAAQRGPFDGNVVGVEVWLRPGTLKVYRWSAEQLAAYRDSLLAQVRRIGQQWGPSPQACQYCPLQLACQARREYVRSAITSLTPVADERYPVSRELIGQLWDKRTELRKALNQFDQIAGEMLAQGPIRLDTGRQLELVASERQLITPSKAFRYLRETLQLNPQEADQVLSVSKTQLARVIQARSARGKGAAAIRQAMADLTEADALETYIHLEKRVTRVEERS